MPYLERVTGGATANETLPLIIAIHGLGDRPERFIALFDALRARARVIAPYGEPYGAGFSFFPIVSRVDPDALAPGIERAVTRLAPLITAVSRARPTRGKPIVTGFSQGGMLSFALAVLHPELVGEALPISGFLTLKLLAAGGTSGPGAPARGSSALALALTLPPITAFHGEADAVVPIAADRLGIARLRELGGRAELHEYPGVVHTVSPDMLRDIEAALEAAVSRAGR